MEFIVGARFRAELASLGHARSIEAPNPPGKGPLDQWVSRHALTSPSLPSRGGIGLGRDQVAGEKRFSLETDVDLGVSSEVCVVPGIRSAQSERLRRA